MKAPISKKLCAPGRGDRRAGRSRGTGARTGQRDRRTGQARGTGRPGLATRERSRGRGRTGQATRRGRPGEGARERPRGTGHAERSRGTGRTERSRGRGRAGQARRDGLGGTGPGWAVRPGRSRRRGRARRGGPGGPVVGKAAVHRVPGSRLRLGAPFRSRQPDPAIVGRPIPRTGPIPARRMTARGGDRRAELGPSARPAAARRERRPDTGEPEGSWTAGPHMSRRPGTAPARRPGRPHPEHGTGPARTEGIDDDCGRRYVGRGAAGWGRISV